MVRAHHKHQSSPGTNRDGAVYWLMTGVLALLSSAAFGAVWVHRNSAQMRSSVVLVDRILARDRRQGVPGGQTAGVAASLNQVLQARVVLIPRFWFGSVGGTPRRLARVQKQADQLLAEARQNEQRDALIWGRRVRRLEGHFSPVSRAELEAISREKLPLRELNRDVHDWRGNALAWHTALRRLSRVSSGLVGTKPQDVVQAEEALTRRLAAQGPYWQGIVNAQQVLDRTRRYLHLSPRAELADHQSMMAKLRGAVNQLQPPTQAQLEAVLGGLSGGLVGNQPADVAGALASLKTRLSGARATWVGYDQAEAAVQLGDTYLQAPLSTQISRHAAVLASLKAALDTLREPVPVVSAPGNPWRTAVVRYLKTRRSVISIAVFNAETRTVTTLNSSTSYVTASIVKATIMATLLWQAETTGHPMTTAEKSLMTTMIEDSDNASATDLWDAAGQAAGIAAFLRAAGLSHTIPGANGYWGLTQTTVLDQVRLVKLLSYPNALLTPASRTYADYLMEHVVGWEDWGVSNGPLGHATVMLKNGWLPIGAAGWEINSIGHVTGDGRNYVIALLSRNNPTEGYGVQTLDTVSKLIWRAL